jgi:DnaJ-class molecular chaperone
MQNNHDNKSDYESLCLACIGKRGWEERGDWYDCPHCDGVGWIPNERGNMLLRLIEHNAKKIMQRCAGD